MPKRHMDVSEWYPVLSLSEPGEGLGELREFSDEEIKEFDALLEQFDKWQVLIAERFGAKIRSCR